MWLGKHKGKYIVYGSDGCVLIITRYKNIATKIIKDYNRVEVYFNLHKRVFSIRSCKTGRVIHHARCGEPTVCGSGRQRVLVNVKRSCFLFVAMLHDIMMNQSY